MKKTVSLFFMMLLVFSSCQMEPKEEAKNPNQDTLLYSGTIEGGQWEIHYQKEMEDGITSEVVNYVLTESSTGKKVGIAVNKQSTSESNSVYKFAIMAARKNEAFPSLFWDRYVINVGQSSMLLDNTIATPGEEEDYYLFVMVGGIDLDKLERLKEATAISVELQSTTDVSRKTTIPVHPNFQRALLSKMPKKNEAPQCGAFTFLVDFLSPIGFYPILLFRTGKGSRCQR